ncbi:MAG: hypothetical protein HY563_08360 [Ignavibacteriales bacterium]|nr:hypothetical protein [Ignavibacteriales bacterium]
MDATRYTRVISKEEAEKGFVFVVKDRLPFFPLAGASFEIVQGSVVRPARIESYPCMCRGPEKPHNHYYVRYEGLCVGDQVTLRKDGKKARRYVLLVRSTAGRREFCG